MKIITHPLLTKYEAAEYLGMTVRQLLYQVERGQGPHAIRLSPKRRYYRQIDLDRWIEDCRGIQQAPHKK